MIERLMGGQVERRSDTQKELSSGDLFEGWRVEAFTPSRHLRLKSTMKMPADVWLEFSLDEKKNGVTLTQQVTFEPKSTIGVFYGYLLTPLRHIIFKGMLRGIVRAALTAAGKQSEVHNAFFLERSFFPQPSKRLFAQFERPGQFERLLPPWTKVKVVSKTDGLHDGAEVVLEIGSLWKRFWHLRHLNYIAGWKFCDEQVSGPFKVWKHIHSFIPAGDSACILEEAITYRLPGGAVGRLFNNSIRRELKRLFHYRQEVISNDIQLISHLKKQDSMRILISGSSGLIGSELVPFLKSNGHQVVELVRKKNDERTDTIWWDPEYQYLNEASLEGFDAVIHLAGKSIGSGRWNAALKKEMMDSRVKGTKLLANTLSRLRYPPKVFLCASAVGIYGDRGEQECVEETVGGSDFLAEVCHQWEGATDAAKKAGIRTVNMRFGVVLTPRGGALATMLTPFKWGVGGKLGSGTQYVSWIAMDDLLALILFALFNTHLSGPVNAVAPFPVTNAELAHSLGSVLRRPSMIPVPAFALHLLLGKEMAQELLLNSTRAIPKKLLQEGYPFLYPQLEGALKHLLGK